MSLFRGLRCQCVEKRRSLAFCWPRAGYQVVGSLRKVLARLASTSWHEGPSLSKGYFAPAQFVFKAPREKDLFATVGEYGLSGAE